MLTYIETFSALDFPMLMTVYGESNRENVLDGCAPDLASVEADFRVYLERDFFTCPGAKYALWTTEEGYVSALRLRPWENGLLLEGLETAPAVRRLGYATRLIRGVCAEQTVPLYAHVGKENAPSLAAFAACGFTRLLEYARYSAVDETLDHMCTLAFRPAPIFL